MVGGGDLAAPTARIDRSVAVSLREGLQRAYRVGCAGAGAELQCLGPREIEVEMKDSIIFYPLISYYLLLPYVSLFSSDLSFFI